MTTVTPVPDPEDIPLELRERQQWLMWDASSTAPRRPHWKGDFSIAWTNPNDWRTFEEAIEAAQERDSWGIGYVFAADNDDCPAGHYGAIDLDGCVDRPHGSLKEWLPSLSPFFDVVGEGNRPAIEWSPSGRGLHIPVANFSPPNWWSNCHVEGGDHEGVEAYGSKFMTVTGDRLRESGDSIPVAGEWLEEWLREASRSITGKDPLAETRQTARAVSADTTSASREEHLTEENIQDALDHIDPDMNYDTWRNVGFALVNFFRNRTTARRLFTTWSRGGSKWDGNAPQLADRIINDASLDGGITIATVIHLAKQGSWTMPKPPRTAAQTDGGDTATSLNSDSASHGSDDPGSTNIPESIASHEKDGGYGQWTYTRDGDQTWNEWTNFTIEPRAYIQMDNGSGQFELTIHPRIGASYDANVPSTAFNDRRRFREAACIGMTSAFNGGERDLTAIREHLAAQDPPTITGVRSVGRYGDELVVPRGSLTANGWAEHPKYRYVNGTEDSTRRIEQGLPVNRDPTPDPENIRGIAERIPLIQETERIIPVIGWFHAAPLRQFVLEERAEFPLLSVTGDSGAGKSSGIETLAAMLGWGGELYGADSTKFALTKALSATNAIPLPLDEYKPSEIGEYRLAQIHDLLRKSTKDGIETRGNADQSVTEYKLQAPVIVSGEGRFGGPAERRRSILTGFSKNVDHDGSEYKKAYAELTGEESYVDDAGEIQHPEGYDLTNYALAYHQWVLGLQDEHLKKQWAKATQDVYNIRESYRLSGVDSASYTALTTIVFGMMLFCDFAEGYGAELPVDQEDIERAAVYVAREQGADGHRVSHLDQFIGLIPGAAKEGHLRQDEDYTIVNAGTSTAEVRVNFARAYPQIREYVKRKDLSGDIDLLNSRDIRRRIREAAASPGGYITCYQQYTTAVSRAFGVSLHGAEDMVDGWDPADFDVAKKYERERNQRRHQP